MQLPLLRFEIGIRTLPSAAAIGLLGLAAALVGCQPAPQAPQTADPPAPPQTRPAAPPSPWQRVRVVRVIPEAHKVPINTIAFDPKSKSLATGSARSGKLWRLPAGEAFVVIKERNAFDATDYSPDGETIASGSYAGEITLSSMADGRTLATFEAHQRQISQLAFDPSGRYIASSSLEAQIKLWDAQTRELVRTFSSPTQVPLISVAFSADGRYLVGGDFDGGLWLWETATGERLRGYVGHKGPVNALAIDPQTEILASGSVDKTLKLWSLDTGQLRATLRDHTEAVSDLAISADGTTLASSSSDKTIRLWDLRSGQAIGTLEGAAFRQVAFAPDGSLLVGAAEDGSLWIWEPDPGGPNDSSP